MDKNEGLYINSVSELCRFLGLGRKIVNQLIGRGLPHIVVSDGVQKTRIFEKQAVINYIQSLNTVGPMN